MNFIDLQQSVRDLIAGSDSFAAQADATVFVDDGTVKQQVEKALAEQGYAVGVWPPLAGKADSQAASRVKVMSRIVVRVMFNPEQLKQVAAANQADATKPTVGAFVNTMLAAVVQSVLGGDPEPGGLKFELADDAFELVNLDEGLLAYHIRFDRLAVF